MVGWKGKRKQMGRQERWSVVGLFFVHYLEGSVFDFLCVWGKPSIITPLKSNCRSSAALGRRREAPRRGRSCNGQSRLPLSVSYHVIHTAGEQLTSLSNLVSWVKRIITRLSSRSTLSRSRRAFCESCNRWVKFQSLVRVNGIEMISTK